MQHAPGVLTEPFAAALGDHRVDPRPQPSELRGLAFALHEIRGTRPQPREDSSSTWFGHHPKNVLPWNPWWTLCGKAAKGSISVQPVVDLADIGGAGRSRHTAQSGGHAGLLPAVAVGAAVGAANRPEARLVHAVASGSAGALVVRARLALHSTARRVGAKGASPAKRTKKREQYSFQPSFRSLPLEADTSQQLYHTPGRASGGKAEILVLDGRVRTSETDRLKIQFVEDVIEVGAEIEFRRFSHVQPG